MTGKVLHALTDLNGDGVADLGVFVLKGESPWKMHSNYQVHLGRQSSEGGTVFAPDLATRVQSDGIPFGMEQHDFDHDGQADMMFTTFETGVAKAAGALVGWYVTRTVQEELNFYRMDGGVYPDKPSASRKITVKPSDHKRKKRYPAVLIGDINGDRRSDLLVQEGQKQLKVFLGVPGPNLFARRPKEVAVAMPIDKQHTWMVDLNKDAKQDILVHHPSTTEPHRITILIAR